MKLPYFIPGDSEKDDFCNLKNQINSFRLIIFAPLMIIIMGLETFSDIKHILADIKLQYYSAYAVIDSLMVFFSILILIISFFYRKNPSKHSKLFGFITSLYCDFLIILSVSGVIVDCDIDRLIDFNLFFFIAIMAAAVFYVNPFHITAEFSVSNVILFILIKYNHWDDTGYAPYAPYCVFIFIALSLCAFIRTKYLLDSMRREEELNKYREESVLRVLDYAEKESELKSLFLANMSHEIRTPMNAIIGMSELALEYNLDDNEKNQIRQIHSSAISLLNIINDILDFSKIESGKMDIVPAEYDLFKLIYDSVNISKAKLAGKKVELIIEMDPKLRASYYGDDLRINQILINLIGNAAKFTEKGFIIVRIEKISGDDKKDEVKFSIIDSGCGIKKEDLEILFDAFRQVDMSNNRNKGGTGLGLSISKKLVQLMGGSLSVVSEYGKGSCFYFQIPQKIISPATCEENYKLVFENAKDNQYHPNLKNLPLESYLNKKEFSHLFLEKTEEIKYIYPDAKILVVDDTEVNLQVAKGLLARLSVVPECSPSGYDALEKLKNNQYDIIYLDHQMPGMDGIETLARIRQMEASLEKKTTVIALSANAVNGAKEKFLASGFDDFVAKPVQRKDFAASLEKWLPPEKKKSSTEQSEKELIPSDFVRPDPSKINLEQAVEFSGGFENWLTAVRVFAKNISSKSEMIQQYLDQKDYHNYTVQVHALKSSAKIIGAQDLSNMAAELEAAGNLIQQLSEKNSKMNEHLLSYQSVLDNICYEKKQENAAEITDDKLKQIISDIKDLANQNNLNDIEDLLNELNEYNLSDSFSELTKQLKSALDDIDFDKIIEICHKII